MRVAIDLTALLPEATGVDIYLKHLVLYLGQLDHNNRYTLFVNYEDRHLFDDLLPHNFAVVPLCLRSRSVRLLFQQVMLPVAARAWGIEVLHSPSFLMPFYRGRPRHLLTVYDMTFFSLPQYQLCAAAHPSGEWYRGVSNALIWSCAFTIHAAGNP